MRFSSLCIGYALLCLLMVPPRSIERANLIELSPDSSSYMAHATSLAFGQFPSYDKEFTVMFPGNYAMGPGFAAAPFVFMFALIDRVGGNPIIDARTKDNIQGSFAPFGFAFAAQVVLFLGLWFSWRACREAGGSNPACSVLLATVSTGLPVYVFRNSVNSHVFEYGAASFVLYVAMAAHSGSLVYSTRLRVYALSGLVALFLFRYNDIVLGAASALAALLSARRTFAEKGLRHRILDVLEIGAVALSAIYLSRALIHATLAGYTGPGFWMPAHLKQQFLSWHGLPYYAGRIVHVFFGPDWGLVFTAPLLLLGIWEARRIASPLIVTLLLAPLLINFAMAISWANHGDEYGYRYFIFSALPIATVGLSRWIGHPAGNRTRLRIAVALGVFSMICTVAYQTSGKLSTHHVTTPQGEAWTNDTLMFEMARQMLNHPFSFVSNIFRSSALQFFLFPMTAETFVKWLSLFLVPLVAWKLARRYEFRHPETTNGTIGIVRLAGIFFNGMIHGKRAD